MKFLIALIDALVGFVQRNPLTVLVIIILALGAPALLKGIALFVLYLLAGIVVLGVVAALLLRRRMNRIRRQMEEQFSDFAGQGPFREPFAGERTTAREGEVKVHKTPETPEKRVSKSVGDYVEFEETKEE